MFNWFRRKIAEAFLGGVQDALDVLEHGSPDQPPLVLPASILARLAGPPQAEGESATTNGRRRKEPVS